jgi:hypothetical protein
MGSFSVNSTPALGRQLNRPTTLSRPRLICWLWRSAGKPPTYDATCVRRASERRAMEPSPGWEVELGQLSTNRLRQLVKAPEQANGARTSTVIGEITHRLVASVQVDQRIPPGRATPVARSRPRPARRSRLAPIRPGGRPLAGGSHRAPDPRATRPPPGARMGGRTSLNRSARAWSPAARTWTTNAPVSRMASKNAEVGSIRPSRRAGWPSATRTEETVRPAPPGSCPAVQTVTGPTGRPRNRRAGSRRSGGTAKGGRLPIRIGSCPLAMPALCPPSPSATDHPLQAARLGGCGRGHGLERGDHGDRFDLDEQVVAD